MISYFFNVIVGNVAVIPNIVGAVVALLVAIWMAHHRQRFGVAGQAIVAGLIFTALRCLVAAAVGSASNMAQLAESAMNFAWFVAVYALFISDGRHESVRPVRPVVIVLCFVEMLQPVIMLLVSGRNVAEGDIPTAFHTFLMLRLMAIIGGLVLVHNLYAGGERRARLALRWPAAALGILWGFDLNFYTVAYLANGWPDGLSVLRGLVLAAVAALLALGMDRHREELKFHPSRAIAFRSISLILIGAYLAAMIIVAQWLSYVGGDFARFAQYGFVAIASVVALLALPSARYRSWLRVALAKHLFQHRYDYRAEWLRFTRTMAQCGKDQPPLEERIIRAVADITDSCAGLLLTPTEYGELALAVSWHWPTAHVPTVAMSNAALAFLEREGFILEFDDLRHGRNKKGEAAVIPDWMRDDSRIWALVPLIHNGRLVGAVVLARPLHARQLDWEDFDLLRVVGTQLASYLAEHAGQEALAEAARFDDFHRRIAFVMHDIKNLASQLSLLARNAEHHAENPEFRADMMITLRNSADKLNALLVRLSRYGSTNVDIVGRVNALEIAASVIEPFRLRHPVFLAEHLDCEIMGDRQSLEQVLTHLVQNAIDASASDSPVFVSVSSDGLYGCFEVSDAGQGMSAEFVRTRLFKPFVSSKPGGFGIGAFEARELVRAMGGRIEVESREGLGSRFTVRLPLVVATQLLNTIDNIQPKVA